MNPTIPPQPTVSTSPASYRVVRQLAETFNRKTRGRFPLKRTIPRPPPATPVGSTWLRFDRRPHSTPTRHWRRSATTAQTRGRQHTKTRPVRGCTPPVVVEYGRWHDPCPPTFQPWVVARYSDVSVQAVSGTAQADTASLSDAEHACPSLEGRRVAHEPGTLQRERKLPSGAWGRPDAPRRNPRPSGRGGCQGSAVCGRKNGHTKLLLSKDDTVRYGRIRCRWG